MSVMVVTLGILAVLTTGVIYGTDVLAAVVLRATYAGIDEPAMTRVVGRAHYFGNRRLPVAGAGSVIAAALTVAAALVAGRSAAAVAAGIGLVALLIWLVLFNRISLPINKVFIAASEAGTTPADARALQDRWDSIINLRSALQGVALVAFCAAIALH